MDKTDFSIHENNEKLLLSILDVLEEKELIAPIRKYSDVPPETLILFLYESHYKDKDEEEAYQVIKKDSFFRTKRRWVRAAIKNMDDPKAPKKELRAKRLFYEDYIKRFGIRDFQEEFKVDSLDVYLKRAIQELEEWAESDVLPIHTYPFFDEKTPRQHKTAIQNDLLVIIGEFLISNTAFFKPIVYQTPNFVMNTQFFGVSTRAKLELDKNKVTEAGNSEDDGTASFYPVIGQKNFGAKSDLNMMVSTNFVTDLNQKVPDLDTKDFELFLTVLSYRDTNFQATRRITFPLKRLVSEIYGSDGAKNYRMTAERLLKLGNYSLTEKMENDNYSVKMLFSGVDILDDAQGAGGEKIVTVYVSPVVYDDYIRQKVVSIYNKKVEKLKGNFAYHLVFVLQKERLVAHQMKERNPVRRKWLDFGHSIRFNRRTKKENLEEFEKAVAQIKEEQFLIQDYYRSGEYYFFTFFPLSSIELEDFSSEEQQNLDHG